MLVRFVAAHAPRYRVVTRSARARDTSRIVRWVLAGDESEALADWLAEGTASWRSWADQVAKHLVTLGVPPDGRVRSSAKDVPIQWVPTGGLAATTHVESSRTGLGPIAEWGRYRKSQATAPETVRLCDVVCAGLETQAHAWSEIAVAMSALQRVQKNAAD